MEPDVSTLRRRTLLLILAGSLSLASCGGAASTEDLQGVVLDPPQPKPEFTLTDTAGNPYDFIAETDGKLTLLYFGYLNCPDICPVHLAQIAETFDRIPDVARETEVVFVSVDPGRDSPEEIRAFLDNFDERFVGLTGTLEEVEAAQAATHGVQAAVFVGEGDDYTVNHAAQVIAFARDGLSHSVYPFGIRQSQWENDLQVLAELER
jgi:protein SCO1/2